MLNREHTNLDTSFSKSDVSLATELIFAAFFDDVTWNSNVIGYALKAWINNLRLPFSSEQDQLWEQFRFASVFLPQPALIWT